MFVTATNRYPDQQQFAKELNRFLSGGMSTWKSYSQSFSASCVLTFFLSLVPSNLLSWDFCLSLCRSYLYFGCQSYTHLNILYRLHRLYFCHILPQPVIIAVFHSRSQRNLLSVGHTIVLSSLSCSSIVLFPLCPFAHGFLACPSQRCSSFKSFFFFVILCFSELLLS